MKKAIVTCAVTEGVATRGTSDRAPRNPEEVALEAEAAVRAGASVVRLHPLDEQGKPTTDVSFLRRTVRRIQERRDCLIEVSTIVSESASLEERKAVLTVKPDIAAIVCGSINLGSKVLIQSHDTLIGLVEAARAERIVTNLVCFDIAQIHTARRLLDADRVGSPVLFSLVLGAEGGINGDMRSLLHMVDALPRGVPWSAAGIGRASRLIVPGALLTGGHARVGFEDTQMLRSQVAATSNSELVGQAITAAAAIGRDIATVDEARALLGPQ